MKLIIFFFLTACICFMSCNEKDLALCTQENQQITQENSRKTDFINRLTLELDNINNAIDSINLDFIETDSSNMDLSMQIGAMDSLLLSNKSRIIILQQNLENQAQSDAELRLAKNVINTLNQQLSKKEREIITLKVNNGILIDSISILSQENIMMSKDISSLEKEKSNLEESINLLDEERVNLRDRVNKMHKDLVDAQKDVLSTEEKAANGYFATAVQVLENFDQIKNVGPFKSKKKRKEYMEIAYDNLREACLLGHTEASNRIKIIFRVKKYYEHLDFGDNVNFLQLSGCGIERIKE